MIFCIVQKRGQQMTKKHVKSLAYMLVGIYVRMVFPIEALSAWTNLVMQLAGVIVFWVSAYKLTQEG